MAKSAMSTVKTLLLWIWESRYKQEQSQLVLLHVLHDCQFIPVVSRVKIAARRYKIPDIKANTIFYIIIIIYSGAFAYNVYVLRWG